MRGAGGSSGGLGHFFIGLTMMIVGLYLLLNAIQVRSSFGMGMSLYGFQAGGFNVSITTGMVMVPFIFGVGIMFYNSKNPIGWLLTFGAIAALLFGVITSVHFSMRAMTAFDLIVILVLSFGGLGLFLRSLKNFDTTASEAD
ncbi:hypothetical protein L2750_19650 [Shewanella submarina]|uniref:DUF4383 domain-containing protein n=1 Tax=Shewanella submarina TaxID=2016376 RepID=A0ABV7G677_9GAMM|nr:hypothetical protein [Shewanella submarina]MCL1039341.1 hypothetical protein [Shewanella submarina]